MMVSRAGDLSLEGANSSLADQTSASCSSVQTYLTMENNANIDPRTLLVNNDSESDVSMSADIDNEEEIHVPTLARSTSLVSPKLALDRGTSPQVSISLTAKPMKKRKHELAQISNRNILETPPDKRQRINSADGIQNDETSKGLSPGSILPAEIWYRILTFCTPRALGSLMRVNKFFYAHIDPSASFGKLDVSFTSLTQDHIPESIWKASRKTIDLPNLPAPLLGKSELDMWKMACGSSCEFCDKDRYSYSLTSVDQWHPGPGENGVVPVWPFGIRTCGSCLQMHSTKEIDLLLSSALPSPLIAALPFVFLSNELHVIAPATLQNGQHPRSIQITKYFFNNHVEEIKREFKEVKSMGNARAEEWVKGLDSRGKERRNDAARWERWEVGGGLGRMRALKTVEKYDMSKVASIVAQAMSGMFKAPLKNGNIPCHLGRPLKQTTLSSQQIRGQQPPQPFHTYYSTASPHFDSACQNGFALSSRIHGLHKHEKTKEELAELKVARKTEIERRCLALEPPITPAVLSYMPSFQAAIQIIQPFTDSAWEVLKPRLLSQREEAEQQENGRLAQTRVVQGRFNTQSKSDPKDHVDREWDDLQAPLCSRIGGYADDKIRDGWNEGEDVSYNNAPVFAAEVLVYVRKRFYEDLGNDLVLAHSGSQKPDLDLTERPCIRKLVLENMKWIYDTKIRPHTEKYRKELFLCNICEYTGKFYGFEGVVQHYAAKHTTTFSMGSMVVYWKSEWPEFPPFNPDPSFVSATTISPINHPRPAVTSSSHSTVGQSFGYGGYHSVPVSGPIQITNSHLYHESLTPYYGQQQFVEQYSSHQSRPYPSPQGYIDAPQVFQQLTYPINNDPSINFSQHFYTAPCEIPSQAPYPSPYPNATHATHATSHDLASQSAAYVPSISEHETRFNQAPIYSGSTYIQSTQKTGKFIERLQNVSRNARDVWNSIGGIKEVPGSLKAHTIIHHVLKNFRAAFKETPDLVMFVDGLTNNKDMRPVRNINGLLCKACSLGMAGSRPVIQKKHLSFPQLVNHFYSVHEQGISRNNYGHIPDWTQDMIELPQICKLKLVVNAPGIDDKKLALLTEALPELVPETVPEGFQNCHGHEYRELARQPKHSQLLSSQNTQPQFYTVDDGGTPSGNVAYDSGEYDPRNPATMALEPRASCKGSHWSHSRHKISGQETLAENFTPNSEQIPRQSSRSIDHTHTKKTYEEVPLYLERPTQYDSAEYADYLIRRENAPFTYEEITRNRDYGIDTLHSSERNRRDLLPVEDIYRFSRDSRPTHDAGTQSRIFDVVAKISKQVQQAREPRQARDQPNDAGSEDGEVLVGDAGKSGIRKISRFCNNNDRAERFLDDLCPESSTTSKSRQQASHHPVRNVKGTVSNIHHGQPIAPQKAPEAHDDSNRVYASSCHFTGSVEEISRNEYIIRERNPLRPSRGYAYMEELPQRERCLELVDRRYKVNNAVCDEERQAGNYRTPSRYARYESVRLENDGAPSTPLYINTSPQPLQYQAYSPSADPLHQEAIYRSRTPVPNTEEFIFERPVTRQEYVRVYTSEPPRPRGPQFVEDYELVRVSDPRGDYLIRRPTRRAPMYTTYKDDIYIQQPFYETLVPPGRPESPSEDAYDPRQPVPLHVAPRKIRYQ